MAISLCLDGGDVREDVMESSDEQVCNVKVGQNRQAEED